MDETCSKYCAVHFILKVITQLSYPVTERIIFEETISFLGACNTCAIMKSVVLVVRYPVFITFQKKNIYSNFSLAKSQTIVL